MNDELQKALADIIASLSAAAEHVGDVASEQLPLLVQEYLRWGFWFHFAVAAMLIPLGGFMAYVAWRLFREARESVRARRDPFGWVMGGGFVSLAAAGILGAAISGHVLMMLKITIAPRVYLLETVSKLVR